ncbi:pectinesterase family protein [Gramella sp. YB25]|uniref:Pectinesterase n=1 Tax=Christiangramia crocea TaxID=2904124 RepID=A0A9X1UV76_9FLAO|nr:pectinesterase family protein [Gramella crocea]
MGGDKAVFNKCHFLGWQDTMYGGRSRQYFKDCYIEGSTDFIFGPSTAFFDSCELFTKGGSAITAASTEEYVTYGYVFKNCNITGTGPNITTLGRPWRPYAAVAFINTEMSSSIKPEGWNNWGNPDNEATARYAEYRSSGEGGATSQRVEWVDILTKEEADLYTIQNVLGTKYNNPPVADDWNPLEVIEETSQYGNDN